MTNIDYSRVKASGHYLYLSEKPCNEVINYNKYNDPVDIKETHCFDDFIHFLSNHDIKTVVILLTNSQIDKFYGESLEKKYKREGFNIIHFPIEDFSTPKNLKPYDSVIKSIIEELKSENVLIHCSAGWGRTGLVAAGIAVYKGHKPDKAISLIRKVRPGSIETQRQEEFIKAYGRYIDLNETIESIFK